MPKQKNVWEVFVAVRSTRRGDIETLWYWRRTAYNGAIAASPTGFTTLDECMKDARLDGLTDEVVDLIHSSVWPREEIEPHIGHSPMVGSPRSQAAHDDDA
jgi:hypothetical protein